MPSHEEQKLIVATVKAFVEQEVMPVSHDFEQRNEYPAALVDRMKQLGLFGINVPEEYGGAGLGATTYVAIFEELSRGWMSIAGVLGTHLVACDMIRTHGTRDQQRRLLPALATGEKRAGIALSEAQAGSDLQAIQTTAVRAGDEYIVNGSKMWITNARRGDLFILLARTDVSASPARRGLSAFAVEKGPGMTVTRDIPKLGYKGIETCELLFENYSVPAANLIGGDEGRGLAQVMTGLETERINVAARANGIARAAFEDAVAYAQVRRTFGKPICEHQSVQSMLAEMATHLEAARQLTYHAARKKDQGERCDLEAGMAKLFATETAQRVALDAMRVFGGNGYTTDFPIERYYRDAPLLLIGGGTNEIQRLVIARNLVKKYSISQTGTT